jgi:hypothetical protein
MAEWFEQGAEPLDWRLRAFCEEQPIRRRGVGVSHAVFEPAIAEPEGVCQRVARIKAGALQPRRLARQARSVVVQNRGLEAAQCAGATLLRRRVAKVDENLAVVLRDVIGSDRIAANQRRAAS